MKLLSCTSDQEEFYGSLEFLPALRHALNLSKRTHFIDNDRSNLFMSRYSNLPEAEANEFLALAYKLSHSCQNVVIVADVCQLTRWKNVDISWSYCNRCEFDDTAIHACVLSDLWVTSVNLRNLRRYFGQLISPYRLDHGRWTYAYVGRRLKIGCSSYSTEDELILGAKRHIYDSYNGEVEIDDDNADSFDPNYDSGQTLQEYMEMFPVPTLEMLQLDAIVAYAKVMLHVHQQFLRDESNPLIETKTNWLGQVNERLNSLLLPQLNQLENESIDDVLS